MVNGTFTSKLTQVNTFLCKVCTSILVYRYYLSPDSCVYRSHPFFFCPLYPVRCISQDFLHAEPVPCSARLEGLCGNSGSIKKNQESRDIQGYYYYSVIITAVQAKSEKAGTFGKHSRYYSENIVGTIGKHISTIAQNSSAL